MDKKARVLFVDDEKDFADAMSQVLRLQGLEVETTYSGTHALQQYVPGEFDLVITDLSMPGMDGIEFIRKVRKLHPAQRIIVITGFPSQRSQEQALKLGTLNYIAKPFKPRRFIELVEDALCSHETGLLGAVRLSPADLIQLYSLMGKTIVLEIHNRKDDVTGRICFEKGQIVHAETGSHQGKEAFYIICSWKSGIFSTEIPQTNVPCTINEGVDALLLEGAHRLDEDSGSEAEKKNKDTNSKEFK